jgi:hypothetical protein
MLRIPLWVNPSVLQKTNIVVTVNISWEVILKTDVFMGRHIEISPHPHRTTCVLLYATNTIRQPITAVAWSVKPKALFFLNTVKVSSNPARIQIYVRDTQECYFLTYGSNVSRSHCFIMNSEDKMCHSFKLFTTVESGLRKQSITNLHMAKGMLLFRIQKQRKFVRLVRFQE